MTTNIHALDQRVPPLFWAAMSALLIVVAAVPAIQAVIRRKRLREWGDSPWWGLIAMVHAGVLAVESVYFYHYATWLLAPLALSTGAAVHYVRSVAWRRVVGATMVVVVLALAVGESRRIVPSDGGSAASPAKRSAEREYVSGMPSRLVEANAVRRNIANGCKFDVTPSVSMVLDREAPGDEHGAHGQPAVARAGDGSTRACGWRSCWVVPAHLTG